jgi:condensin complex subunit 2
LQINISYAKIAKKMDVKVLKDSLWDTLTDTVPAAGTKRAAPRSEDDADTRVVAATQSFAEVITELPRAVPDDIMENVSVPFCFICLLHLANEHQLEIQSDGLADLRISQPAM